MKKTLSVLLAVFMLCFVLGCVAYADEFSGEGSFDVAMGYSVNDIKNLVEDEDWAIVSWDPFPSCEDGGIVWARIPDAQGNYGDPQPIDVAALGHNWHVDQDTDADGWFVVYDVPATCSEQGVQHEERYCDGWEIEIGQDTYYVYCDAEESTDPYPAPMLEHKYRRDPYTALLGEESTSYAVLEEPDCVNPGLGHLACKFCGALDPDSEDYVIPATGVHKYGSWNVKIQPTCTETGYRIRFCNVENCRYQQDEIMDPLGHHFVKTDEWRIDCETYGELWECDRDGCDAWYTVEHLYLNDPEVGNHPTEPYLHHRYSLDWGYETDADKPTCMKEGKGVRICDDCGYHDYRVEPKLPHDYSSVVRTEWVADDYNRNLFDESIYIHWNFCKVCGSGLKPSDDAAFWEDGVDNGCVVPLFDYDGFGLLWHDWNEWICNVEPTATSAGQWYRTCKIMDNELHDGNCLERQEFIGTRREFDDLFDQHAWSEWEVVVNPDGTETWTRTCENCGEVETIVVPAVKNGLVCEIEDNKPVWKYYKDDVFQKEYTGILDFDGGRFFVAEGVMCSDANGLNLYDGKWYFLANGQIQDQYTGVAIYDNAFFFIEEGVLADGMTGLVDHDGETFAIVEGRILSETSGLWHNNPLWEGDGDWYFLAYGRVVKEFTGLTTYDGEWFYVENGKVIVDYTGPVDYEGETFEMVNGKLVA